MHDLMFKLTSGVFGRPSQSQGTTSAREDDLNGPDALDKSSQAQLENAAEQGNSDAQFELGCRLFFGAGLPKDERRSVAWLDLAASQGHAGAQNHLGVCYREGLGVNRDLTKAADSFARAARFDHPEGCFNFGQFYLSVYENTQNDERALTFAFRWFAKARDLGMPKGEFFAARMLLHGDGVRQDVAGALGWMNHAALRGHVGAQAMLGICYAEGTGGKQDLTRAMKWLEVAANNGNTEAQARLGMLYLDGSDPFVDPSRAVFLLTQAAQAGEANAQAVLGCVYLEGQGVTKDVQMAVSWLTKAAEQNQPGALLVLGQCYADGIGVDVDLPRAVALLTPLAESGDSGAQAVLGCVYLKGQGVAEDVQMAVSWLTKAAAQNDPEALVDLGRCYAEGIGVPADPSRAAALYGQAAQTGDATIQTAVGIAFLEGYGVVKNVQLGVSWLTKAAEQNHTEALVVLGRCYAEGHGVAVDIPRAVALVTPLAESGNASAQAVLGCCYLEEQSVTKDVHMAVSWLTKAAEQDDPDGQRDLGCLLCKGDEVEQDLTTGKHWLTRAAQQGDAGAQYNLGYIAKVEDDFDLAKMWFEKSAEQDHPDGQRELGWLLCKGEGVKRDLTTGKHWLTRAAHNGDSEAQYHLGELAESGHDFDTARMWFEKSAQQEHPDAAQALDRLARRDERASLEMTLHDKFIDATLLLLDEDAHDDARAVALITEAAAHGDPDAEYFLAGCYLSGKGVAADVPTAISWLRRAADHGNLAAAYELGTFYESGSNGLPRDLIRARQLLEQAASSTDPSDFGHDGDRKITVTRTIGEDASARLRALGEDATAASETPLPLVSPELRSERPTTSAPAANPGAPALAHWGDIELPADTLAQIEKRIGMFNARDPATPRGLLLCGPPGTGKTILARAIANRVSAEFMPLSVPDLKGGYLGQSGQKVKALWAEARSHDRAIIFIDECEGVFTRRGGVESDQYIAEIVQAFLAQWDGIDRTGQVWVIGATNRRDLLDEAIVSRFGSVFQIPMPTRAARLKILTMEFGKLGVDALVPDSLVDDTRGLSGRDLSTIVRNAKTEAWPAPPSAEHFGTALADLKKRTSTNVDPLAKWDRLVLDERTLQDLQEVAKLLELGEVLAAQGVALPRGMLLYGPPGTGKTQIARTLANEAKLHFVAATTADLKGQYLGQSGQKVREVFERARANSPAILFIDELDMVAAKRAGTGEDQYTREVVAQMLQEMDGIVSRAGHVFVVAATNALTSIDAAILSHYCPVKSGIIFVTPNVFKA